MKFMFCNPLYERVPSFYLVVSVVVKNETSANTNLLDTILCVIAHDMPRIALNLF